MSSLRKYVRAAVPLIFGPALLAVPAGAAAQETGELVERLEAGEWIWSEDFPAENPAFLGFASGLLATVRAQCGSYAVSPQEELFSGSWIMTFVGRSASEKTSLSGFIETNARSQAGVNQGHAFGRAIITRDGCPGGSAPLFQNALSLVSGGRPVHGGGPSTLVSEDLGVPSTRHVYDPGAFLPNRALEVVEEHMQQAGAMGLRILECTYDEDTSDGWKEAQYHWTAPVSQGLTAVGALQLLVDAAEDRLHQRLGHTSTSHPFKQFGFPKTACPAMADEDLSVKRIAGPRPTRATAAEGSAVETDLEPEVHRAPGLVRYDYGSVPESFIPPMPETYRTYANWDEPPFMIEMEKETAGVLIFIDQWPSWRQFSYLPSDVFMGRSPEADRINEDIRRIGEDDGREFPWLHCKYNGERSGTVRNALFWHREVPEWVTLDYLYERSPHHPLLRVGPAVEWCPATVAGFERVYRDYFELTGMPLHPENNRPCPSCREE